MNPKIILLNGPSSSGKSTLARELQKILREERKEVYEIVSIDDFLKMTTEDVIYEDDVFEISPKLCEKALEHLEAKRGVIIDHVITSERIFEQLKEMLSAYPICLVHVTCPVEILKQREAERGNRCIGSAEASFEYLYPKEGYDVTIDTYGLSLEKGCTLILDIERLSNSIKREENEFPKWFASYVEKDYGILFYMEDNKDSYDGNHACIYPEKITDLGAVLDDIAAFYGKMGRRASIYHPFVKDYFKDNEGILNAHGFTYTPEEEHRVMLLTAENEITTPKRMDIRVLQEWDERVATDILIPSGEPWEVDVTRKRMAQDGTYLFVGYLDGKAVAYTDIHKSKYGNTRFDYIVTAKEHRGKAYASELLSFVIEYCKENDFPMCWQWAGPSEHICYRAGFREAFSMEAGFASGPEL